MAPLNVPSQPAQLYELVWELAAFGIVWKLREHVKGDGALLAIYAALYSFGRFFISALRPDNLYFGELRQAQLSRSRWQSSLSRSRFCSGSTGSPPCRPRMDKRDLLNQKDSASERCSPYVNFQHHSGMIGALRTVGSWRAGATIQCSGSCRRR